jgi:basic amino acid/polyamine antiporter, APA family
MIFSPQTLKAMGRRKTLAEAKCTEDSNGGGLLRSLTGMDLILYGVGSSVGAGIYVMVGIGASLAGPAISISFLACGLVSRMNSMSIP